ncbi:hypothetical protein OOZ51_17835 [Arthrobacter sp. MI7-26]|uniref:hypothetical protein n=1 Tax=Arthrobacter sp. MI7-26 TaxID=2993653 RepID=UPI00224905F9|nr:hypothetical protein [Arthrobacter sp. MI7-26]MCX2749655.1 hypothetical protein [Arthrobacter sp. MI7-26]
MTIIGIAVASLIWLVVGPAVDPLTRILVAVAHVFLGATGVVILIGRSRRDRLMLTRRRWKYASSVVLGGTGLVLLILSIASPRRSPTPTLYSMFLGMGLSQLFEPASAANLRTASLSERDAKTWKRIGVSLLVAGIVIVAGGAAISALTGLMDWSAALIPVGLMALVFSVIVWVLLRARTGQSRSGP